MKITCDKHGNKFEEGSYCLNCYEEGKVARPVHLDMVNKPPHYTKGNIEVSDFIIDQGLNFLEGNVVKYVCRHKFKNGIEDLKKAEWYLKKLIANLEAKCQKSS